MIDTRFDGYPVDDRFKTPGVDDRFPAPGTDVRFATPGRDARFPDGGTEPGATLYLNHLFLGGAPSGPILGNNPPTNHAIGFNTVNAAPIQLGDTWFGWEINPEVASGRSYLTYSLAQNNPNLQIGDVVRISWVVRKYAGSGNVVLAFSNQIGVNVTEENTRAVDGQDVVVSFLVEITEAGYDFSTRIGTGVTSNQSAHMLITEPKLVLVSGTTSSMLLETGDVLLLETGDKLLLEA